MGANGNTRLYHLHEEVKNLLFTAVAASATKSKDQVVLRPGLKAIGILRVAANIAEGETVTIGTNVFEYDVVNTDSTINVSNNDLNNTNNPAKVTHAAHGQVAGNLVRFENEICKILRIIDANSYVVARGRCGTSVATHANGVDIFVSATPPAANIPVGVVTTLTPAVATPALAAEINNALAGGERATAKASTIFSTHLATSLLAGAEMLLQSVAEAALTTSLAETLAGANNVWAAAAMAGGAVAAVKRVGRAFRVPNATEVALDEMQFVFGFTPTSVDIFVRVTATGVVKAWDGGF